MKHASYLVVVFLTLGCLASAQAETFTGSLLYTPPLGGSDGIVVGDPGGLWASNKVALSWTVSNEDNTYAAFPWRYEYHITQESGQAGFSHLMLEASGGFTASDLTRLTGATLLSVGVQQAGPADPGMPAELYGIRLAPIDAPGSWTFSFYSNRLPVWGDFYAKGGYGNYAYNEGFTSDDHDPAASARDGSMQNHLLRPDAHAILRPDNPAPEPATIVHLAALAAVVLGGYLWRRRWTGIRPSQAA